MTTLGYCLTQQHDLRILLLAVGLVALTMATGGRLYQQSLSRNRRRRRRRTWIAACAVTVGAGIWSVHFVAALAYLPGLPLEFRAAPTIVSLVLIVAGALVAFLGGAQSARAAVHVGFGALFGLCVAAMHYLGMAAMVAPGVFAWSSATVAVSVVLAAGFCALGLRLAMSGKAAWRLYSGGAAIALGVLCLHFVGMSAIAFHFDPRVSLPPQSLSRPELALLVTGVSVFLMACGAVTVMLNRRDRRQALARMQLLAQSSFEGVALIEDDVVIDCNAAFADLAARPREALLNRPWLKTLFVPDADAVFGEAPRVEGVMRGGEDRTTPVEVLARRLGGSKIIVAVRDLTERRQKEESLALLFHRNPAPVWACDPTTGTMLAVNPAALALYGYDEAAFRALTVRQLLAPEEIAPMLELVRGGLTRFVPDRPWRHMRADGTELLVLPYAESILYEGRHALLTTVFDVTERERTAQALERAKDAAEAANRAKSAFLANMSHEIRTPLNGVLGMSQAIASGELSPLQRQRLAVVRQSGEALLHILDDILDISRIEAGRVELEILPFELDGFLHELVRPFEVQARGKGLEFELSVGPQVGGRYEGDPTRLRQVLSNLLANALKFTASGAVRLDVARTADGRLSFAVSDTGEGVAPEALSRLFDKFVQADVSTTRRHGGAGLGLAISRELASLMGGELEANSEPGQGSTFTLTLPLPATSCELETPCADGELAEREAGEVRILAVEDNAMNQTVLRTLLALDGLRLEVVENGQAALDAWRIGRFDLILMDVQMPIMDGPTATRCIRAEEAGSGRPRTPILGLTANVMRHQIAEYRAAGMDGYVAKPIDVGLLFSALNDALAPPPAEVALAG